MKKSKVLPLIILIIVLFNFIFCNYNLYAVTSDSDAESESEEEDTDEETEEESDTITYSKDSYDKLTEEGTVELGGEDVEVSASSSSVGSSSGVLASIVSQFLLLISNLLNFLASQGGITGGEGYTELASSAYNTGKFTICSLVFGEYLLFNIDIFQTNSDLNPDVEATVVSNIIDGLKTALSVWYTLIKWVSIALIAFLAAFAGIMFLVQAIKGNDIGAESRARFKETLIIWVTGLVFIFACPYIISIINYILNAFMDFLWNIRYNLEEVLGYSSFETELLDVCINGVTQYGGMKCLAYMLEFLIFLIAQIRFFGAYIVRLFKILILVVLAPLAAIGDLFSRLSGGQAKLKNWIYQYLMCLLMQPIQAIIYLIFMFTLSQIAINAPLLGILFLWMLLRAEKIVKVILNFDYGKIARLFSNSVD